MNEKNFVADAGQSECLAEASAPIRKRGVVSVVIVSILSAHSSLFVSFFIGTVIDFLALRLDENAGLEGLGAAVLLIFMIICGIAIIVLSLIALIWSIVARRKSEGGVKVVFLVNTIANIAMPVFTVAVFVSILIINNMINSGAV